MIQRVCDREIWTHAQFRKSSRSNGGSQPDCVELAHARGRFGVRDSKLGQGSPVFSVSPADLGGLLAGIKSGEIA